MQTAEQTWQATLGQLQLQMTKATFDTWFKHTQLVSYEDNTFVIGVQNGYAKDWLENRLNGTVERTLSEIAGCLVQVRFVVHSSEADEEEALVLHQDLPQAISWQNGHASKERPSLKLNSKYTFDKFIVGASNRLAHAASLAVAERPAEAYNPLFLYGGVGLGKTHLLQAVAHKAKANQRRVIYISSETFTNDLINAIRNRSTEDFREKYRNTDFLLIDDIQFIAGKESTQEEFFHTFNTLHSSGGQIVLTSDRPPKAIITLEERLRSRFEWGLLADVQLPDLETRIAILRFKAEEQGICLPDDVVEFIAKRIQSNIRELEGALNKVIAQVALTRTHATIELAKIALLDLVARQSNLTADLILSTVAEFYGISEDDLKSKRRSKEITHPRHMAMYLTREETNASLPEIGTILGGRDHTTILYGCDKMTSAIERDGRIRQEMMAIREMLYQKVS
ncbi:MAG: chromosomal replication initiator protein DnaA [Anaerolineae bacterium]